jgi:hypothetical protein
MEVLDVWGDPRLELSRRGATLLCAGLPGWWGWLGGLVFVFTGKSWLRWAATGGEGCGVSLNRYEQAIFEYLQSHPDEGRHWENKVSTRAARGELAASTLADELWDYVRERAAHTQPFRDWAARGGVQRTSLLNLAEYLIRLWGPVAPKRKPPVL